MVAQARFEVAAQKLEDEHDDLNEVKEMPAVGAGESRGEQQRPRAGRGTGNYEEHGC